MSRRSNHDARMFLHLYRYEASSSQLPPPPLSFEEIVEAATDAAERKRKEQAERGEDSLEG